MKDEHQEMPVEIGLVWSDGTWDSDYFFIPSTTLDSDIEERAVLKALKLLAHKENPSLVKAFLFNFTRE